MFSTCSFQATVPSPVQSSYPPSRNLHRMPSLCPARIEEEESTFLLPWDQTKVLRLDLRAISAEEESSDRIGIPRCD